MLTPVRVFKGIGRFLAGTVLGLCLALVVLFLFLMLAPQSYFKLQHRPPAAGGALEQR